MNMKTSMNDVWELREIYLYIPKTNTADLIPPCLLGLQDLPLQSTEISWPMGSPLKFCLDSISIWYHHHLLSLSCCCSTYSNLPSNQRRKNPLQKQNNKTTGVKLTSFTSVVNWTKLCLVFIIDIHGNHNKNECKGLTDKERRRDG